MGVLDKLDLAADEKKLDSWTLMYEPQKGGKFNGKLLVTTKRLCYDAQFDVSVGGLVGEALFIKRGSEAYLEIPRERIRNVAVKKGLFSKRVLLTLDDGSVHTFNRGMMSIDPVAAAIGLT